MTGRTVAATPRTSELIRPAPGRRSRAERRASSQAERRHPDDDQRGPPAAGDRAGRTRRVADPGRAEPTGPSVEPADREAPTERSPQRLPSSGRNREVLEQVGRRPSRPPPAATRDADGQVYACRAPPRHVVRSNRLLLVAGTLAVPGVVPLSDTVVFIPAWNEEQNLPAVLDELHRELPDADVLVVDDGSTDRTAEVAREHGAEVLSFGENRGLRAGIAAGYAWALEHEYAFCGRVDADGQHPAHELRKLLELVRVRRDGRRRRLALRQRPGYEPYRYEPEGIRKLGTGLLRRSMRVALGRPFNDATSGLYAANGEGAARALAAVRERRPGGRGAAAPARRGPARRGGAGRHARACERRVEAEGQEGVPSLVSR